MARASTRRDQSQCGDDRALEELDLAGNETMIAVDDGLPAFPWRQRR